MTAAASAPSLPGRRRRARSPAASSRSRRCRSRRSSRRAPCGPDRVGHHVDLGRNRVGSQITTQSDFAISRGRRRSACPFRRHSPARRSRRRSCRRSGNSAWRGSGARSRRASPGPWCRRRNRARRFPTERPFRREKRFRDPVERLVPTDRRELPGAFGRPHERLRQASGLDALGVAGDLAQTTPDV